MKNKNVKRMLNMLYGRKTKLNVYFDTDMHSPVVFIKKSTFKNNKITIHKCFMKYLNCRHCEFVNNCTSNLKVSW